MMSNPVQAQIPTRPTAVITDMQPDDSVLQGVFQSISLEFQADHTGNAATGSESGFGGCPSSDLAKACARYTASADSEFVTIQYDQGKFLGAQGQGRSPIWATMSPTDSRMSTKFTSKRSGDGRKVQIDRIWLSPLFENQFGDSALPTDAPRDITIYVYSDSVYAGSPSQTAASRPGRLLLKKVIEDPRDHAFLTTAYNLDFFEIDLSGEDIISPTASVHIAYGNAGGDANYLNFTPVPYAEENLSHIYLTGSGLWGAAWTEIVTTGNVRIFDKTVFAIRARFLLIPLKFDPQVPVADQMFFQGYDISPFVLPEATGGTAPISYSLTPALPAGLNFDASSRTISGNPAEVTAAPVEFTFTVTDAAGLQDSLMFTIEVNRPRFVTSTGIDNQSYPRSLPISPLMLPEATGMAPVTYALAPSLPQGLAFDASSRTISGTPTEVTPPVSMTYTFTDGNGAQDSLKFTIEVYQSAFSSSIENQSYPRARPIAPLLLPEVTGTAPIIYALTPSLPQGLSFDASNRTIYGTPTEVTPPVPMTYTSTDGNGAQDSLKFTIEVFSPVASEHEELPGNFALRANYPNPFRDLTNVVFDLPWSAEVQVEVFDVMGRRMMTMPAVDIAAGWEQEIQLNGSSLPSGIYLYRLTVTSPQTSSVHIGHLTRIR